MRRKVKTGERISRRYPNPNINALQISYGIRLVCSACARAIDLEEARKEWLRYFELALALAVLAIALAMKLFA